MKDLTVSELRAILEDIESEGFGNCIVEVCEYAVINEFEYRKYNEKGYIVFDGKG